MNHVQIHLKDKDMAETTKSKEVMNINLRSSDHHCRLVLLPVDFVKGAGVGLTKTN